MKTINVPKREEVAAGSQLIFDQMQQRLGKVPNLYATIGYSPNALKGFVDFEATFNHGVFNAKQREAIALRVSELNGCAYCLAGHTVLAMKNGFTKEETLAIRSGKTADKGLNALLALVTDITELKGHASDEAIAGFYAAGFKEEAIMELIGLVTVRIFTNYVYALTDIPVDFPAVEQIS